MNKKIIGIGLAVIGTVLVFSSPAAAKNAHSRFVPPAIEGVYDVPQEPDMQVQVFVYKKNPDKIKTTASLTCTDDPNSTMAVHAAGWRLSLVRTPYLTNIDSAPAGVVRDNLTTIVSNSFAPWSSNSNGKFSFTSLGATALNTPAADGANIIAWGSTPSNALAVTYIWYNRRTKLVSDIDTIMSNAVTWNWWTPATADCASSSYDAQNILVHELGHWVGLNDEYNARYYQNATMYGYGSRAEIKKDTLSAGDIRGIKSIYR